LLPGTGRVLLGLSNFATAGIHGGRPTNPLHTCDLET
jgi:hypothetical protein